MGKFGSETEQGLYGRAMGGATPARSLSPPGGCPALGEQLPGCPEALGLCPCLEELMRNPLKA